MKSTYKIFRGYGDPENTKTLWGLEFLELTFSNERHAEQFAWDHYAKTLTGNPEWQSLFYFVTTSNNETEALADLIADMNTTTKGN